MRAWAKLSPSCALRCCCEMPILGNAEKVNDWSVAAWHEISALKASFFFAAHYSSYRMSYSDWKRWCNESSSVPLTSN
jgi:hypothetical protein